jgi:hypothetical protein
MTPTPTRAPVRMTVDQLRALATRHTYLQDLAGEVRAAGHTPPATLLAEAADLAATVAEIIHRCVSCGGAFVLTWTIAEGTPRVRGLCGPCVASGAERRSA